MNQNGMPWGEDDLNAFLRKEGGQSDIQGGKMTYQDMNPTYSDPFGNTIGSSIR
jgi:hypothetical protein